MSSQSSSGGIGIVGLTTIVFVVLKLVGTISWPWIWVLSPLWISFAAVILIVIAAIIIAFIAK